MNEERIYIVCEYCKIGGYDFCPMCFGGGGYSIQEKETRFSQKIISKDDFTKISDTLNLIEFSNTPYNEKIEKYLDTALIQLTSNPVTEKTSNLLNQIVRIKAKKETKYWVERFKEDFRKLDLDFFKIAITNETTHISRNRLKLSSPNDVIICFAANKEIFNNDSEILDLLPNLIDNSIFKIRYGQNDMTNPNSKKLIHNSDPNNILGFDINSYVGNAFFIMDIKPIQQDK